jgi:hypothetical protein
MKRSVCLLITALAVTVVIFSCRKSIEYEPIDDGLILPSNAIESKIQAFKDHMDNNLKDGKTYSIDSAIWYSTAFLNYMYAIYDSALQNISCDTSAFSIELDENNKVEEALLEEAIEQMTDSMEAQYDGLQESTKHLVYCMVYEIATYQGRLDVGTVAVIGFGYSPNIYEEFGEEDYWYAILDSGMCDDYAPAYKGEKDAGEEIAFKILHPLITNDPIYRVYTVPESQVFITVDPEGYPYENSPCGHRGYYHHAQGSWPGPQCLDPDHLNFYLTSNGIEYIIDDMKPEGLDFTWIEIRGDILFLEDNWYEEVHLLDLTYAETYLTLTPASGL